MTIFSFTKNVLAEHGKLFCIAEHGCFTGSIGGDKQFPRILRAEEDIASICAAIYNIPVAIFMDPPYKNDIKKLERQVL